MKITYENDGHGLGFIVRPVRMLIRDKIAVEEGEIEEPSVYIQVDYDFPALARTFGWTPKPEKVKGPVCWDNCWHHETDGTISCPGCGKTASEFIQEAGEWLRLREGIETEDPGYF